jgi:threonine/homoserine efflux transporter RhtA
MISRFKNITTIKNSIFRTILGISLIIIPFFLNNNQTLGALLAVIGGTSTLFYNIITYKLTSKTNITATQTLAVRFWGLFIILLIIIGNKLNLSIITPDTIIKLIILAFLSFILQIWLSQKGLYAIGVKYHGIIISLTPLGTLLLQGIILNQWYWNFLALTIICPFILNDTLWEKLMFFKVDNKANSS